jgi:hypothetical protein
LHYWRLHERAMLNKFSDEIQECNQFADECRRIADETDDLSRRQDYLDMEARWLQLARSPAFLEQISNFKAAIRKAAATKS